MANITILIDGQPVSSQTTPDIMRAMVIRSMEEQLAQKLRHVVCPEHQAQPDVVVSITHGKQEIAVEGCCQRLIDMTTRALTAP